MNDTLNSFTLSLTTFINLIKIEIYYFLIHFYGGTAMWHHIHYVTHANREITSVQPSPCQRNSDEWECIIPRCVIERIHYTF